jgi:hypothetical protein
MRCISYTHAPSSVVLTKVSRIQRLFKCLVVANQIVLGPAHFLFIRLQVTLSLSVSCRCFRFLLDRASGGSRHTETQLALRLRDPDRRLLRKRLR